MQVLSRNLASACRRSRSLALERGFTTTAMRSSLGT
jgi:hypothetical protein